MIPQNIKYFVSSMEVNKKYPLENSVYDSVEIQLDKCGHSILFRKGHRYTWITGRLEGVVKLWKKESSCKKALEKYIEQYQRKDGE